MSVRLSLCLSLSPAAVAYGAFAAVGPAGRRYRSIAARSAPQQHGTAARRAAEMRAVPRLQLTQEAEHRLVLFLNSLVKVVSHLRYELN